MNVEKHKAILENLFLMAQDVQKVSNSRIAAALVYKNNIIGYGVNQYKTHPMADRYKRRDHEGKKCLHAEVACIRNVINRRGVDILKKSTLYVARAKSENSIDLDLTWGFAMPCEGCQRAIIEFRIPEVFYTTNISGIIAVSRFLEGSSHDFS